MITLSDDGNYVDQRFNFDYNRFDINNNVKMWKYIHAKKFEMMTDEEKLYWKAKEAYYNSYEIMTDYEFDALEKRLGFENKSTIGSKHNSSYTVKHPYIMGSLNKVQIHKDKEGNIDWNKYKNEISKYIRAVNCIVTPKFDGCSFECKISDHKIIEISSRGDGIYGRNLFEYLKSFIPIEYLNLSGTFTLRGEVLVKKNIFKDKYADLFTNPRSFVSGVLNRDYSINKEFQDMANDLSIVIYDYRIFENNEWIDHDWVELPITDVLPQFHKTILFDDNFDISDLYNKFSDYRQLCEYALDGIVIKPIVGYRINNTDEARPKDCVAVKFIPMLEETEVINITWNLGKTHELIPLIWVRPVEMDGRIIHKCSGHNLGYLRSKHITIGSKIIISLAGDIIPFIYKVTYENKNGEIPMPTIYDWYEDDIHLMAILSDEDKYKMKFLASATALQIPSIGPETAKDIFGYMVSSSDKLTNEFFGEETHELPSNIILTSQQDIYFGAGGGKSGDNALKGFKKIIDNLTLSDIIKSCNFKLCGGKVADQIANYLVNGEADWSHLALDAYNWVFNPESQQMAELKRIITHFGKTFDDYKKQYSEIIENRLTQIPIIMTGEPTKYKSKAEFLQLHPEYRNTTSWKEAQIVFTNSIDSNTGKMKKAKEKGIKIELY